jgi:hypothetical protein
LKNHSRYNENNYTILDTKRKKKMKKLIMISTVLILITATGISLSAQTAAEDMAKQFQNPLASIRGIMTDNDVLINYDGSPTKVLFQLQPVYAVDFPEAKFSLVNRAILPFGGSPWALNDILLQFMFAPYVKGGWKWGIGPQFSLKTRTANGGGPGWGAGAAFVVVGNLGPVGFTGLASQHFSFDGNVSFMTLQPIFAYTIPAGGSAVNIMYAGTTLINWKASSDAVTLPLGIQAGMTFVTKNGTGIDWSIGPYWNVLKQAGAPDMVVKIGLNVIFP